MRIDQFVFRNLVYFPVALMQGQNVSACLRALRASERIPADMRRDAQQRKLSRLLAVARQESPGYQARLAHVDIDRVSIDRMPEIPTLTKQELRNERAELLARTSRLLCSEKTTGGSTGEPVTVRKTAAAMAWELAATWRGYGWAGIGVGDLQARFWGVPITPHGRRRAHLIDFVCHRRRFSAFDFDRSSFPKYAAKLEQLRPDYFYGYVSMIAELARWYVQTGRQVSHAPKAVVTTSEVLNHDDRAAITTTFKCPVFNEYGCGELGTVAHECEYGRLHTSDENMLVEVLDGSRPCAAGEKGELVVTELNNFALPLIRYRTGDFGALTDEPCPCGRTLGVLDTIYGREYDFIVTTTGRKFHAEFLMYIFEEAQRQDVGISQFRVVQQQPDLLLVSVVPGPLGFSETDEARLVARMGELLGPEMRINLSRVEFIPRERSGKMRIIVGLDSVRSREARDTGTGPV